jgi:hypothetical protein
MIVRTANGGTPAILRGGSAHRAGSRRETQPDPDEVEDHPDPLTLEPDEELRRGFGMHLFLTFVTLGIFGIVWDYRLHTDPDKVYPEFYAAEDGLLSGLRNTPARSQPPVMREGVAPSIEGRGHR